MGLGSHFGTVFGEIIFRAGRVLRRLEMVRRRIESKFPLRRGFSVDFDGESFCLRDASGSQIWVATSRRFGLYAGGISLRLKRLASEYCLSDELFEPGELLIDVGANVGELGMWAKTKDLGYFGIEPDPVVYAALTKNMGTENSAEVALGERPGEAHLYINTETADTSLFPTSSGETVPAIEVSVMRLDDLLRSRGISSEIGLLKVEAEGFEPEVLRGASATLSRTRWCAVDAGPERDGKCTLPAVLEVLLANGFRLIDAHRSRNTYLFGNSKFLGFGS